MLTLKCFGIVAAFLLAFSQNLSSQIMLQGVITDAESEPIRNALVELIDQADVNRKFSSTTNETGHYSIQIPTKVEDALSWEIQTFKLFQNYPNPFNPSTVIEYELERPAYVRLDIYNTLGQLIKSLFSGFQPNLYNRVVWDATNDRGHGVPAGVYIYSLTTEGVRINKKMLLIDGQQINYSALRSTQFSGINSNQIKINKVLSDVYLLRVTGNNIQTYEQQKLQIVVNTTLDIVVSRTTVTGNDGTIYRTVKIGDQWWMAENIKETQYQNGDEIPNVISDSEWANLSSGAWCIYADNDTLADTYGYLYNWFAANDNRNIAPEGWHIPSDEEWNTLIDYLGGDSVAGGKMKETGTTHWESPNTGATNESGFSALPGGSRRGPNGQFQHLCLLTRFWSSTEETSNNAWFRMLDNEYSRVIRQEYDKHYGFSIRCVKD
jgi:uncharacterized protein (TIGR02145 family)